MRKSANILAVTAVLLSVLFGAGVPQAWAVVHVVEAPRYVQGAPEQVNVVTSGIDESVYANNVEPSKAIQREGRTAFTSGTVSTSESLPSRFDARSKGWVTNLVRNQDPWGTCWAISALEAMETNLLAQGKTLKDSLSVRQLVWAAGTPLPSSANANLGNAGIQPKQFASQKGEGQHASPYLASVYGNNAPFEMAGNYYVVYQTIASGRGPWYENQAPYMNDEGIRAGNTYAAEGTWGLSEKFRFNTAIQMRHTHVLPVPAHYDGTARVEDYVYDAAAVEAVKKAIQTYGSVAIAYDSSDGHYDAENNTWFSDDSVATNHGVQIVGWDDSIPRECFTTGTYGLPEGDGAWIVRNSWGAEGQVFPNESTWGDGGYFYLSYYDRSAQMFVAYDMMLASDKDATNIINQYDYLGQMSQASARVQSGAEEMASANVFTAEVTQDLKAVSVDTYAPGSRVEVEIYLLGSEAANPAVGTVDPTAGTLLEQKEVTFDYGGYHRIQLNKAHRIKKGQRFSVVQRVVEPDGTYVASLEAGNSEQAMDRWGYYHYDTVVVNEGESYVYGVIDEDAPAAWMDATEVGSFLTAQSNVSTPYGNICIKAFSDAVKTNSDKKDTAGNTKDSVTTSKNTPAARTSKPSSSTIQATPAYKPVQGSALAATADTVFGCDTRLFFRIVFFALCFGFVCLLRLRAVAFVRNTRGIRGGFRFRLR